MSLNKVELSTFSHDVCGPIKISVTFSEDCCQLKNWMTSHRHLPNGLPPNQGYRHQSGLLPSLDTYYSLPFYVYYNAKGWAMQ